MESDGQTSAVSEHSETLAFRTEARQLLDLMIHSVYSNKDIFLRELISNASDALDKRRFEALLDPDLGAGEGELRIVLEADRAARTLSVHDNGIGMTRQEVIDLIGTIAKSGTREFLDLAKQAENDVGVPDLIGQFGVGFYSCFMVSEHVTLVTRRAGHAAATRWESSGEGTFTIQDAERDEPGTTATLRLKTADAEDGLRDYTDEWTIRELVKRYSDFVAYPIQMETERKEIEQDADGHPKPDAEEKTVRALETLNSMKALWLRDPGEVSEDEYHQFYRHISHDWQEPLRRIQAKIEGTLEYRLLLFVPSSAPLDLYYRDGRHGIHLYIRRVFIMDDCKVLLPEYLRFVRGVVDSEDLSLNISREMLQQDRQIQRIRKGVTGKVLDTLKQMRDHEREIYLKFWGEFGRVLKEGLFQDGENREMLLGLLLCESTEFAAGLTSLDEYVARMKPDQSSIYYMTGEKREAVERSPHLEAFRSKGYEVLFLTDPVDEIWLQSIFEYRGKRLQSIGKGDVELGTEEERKRADEDRKEKQKEYAPLLDCLRTKLEEHVKDVRFSNRLTSSAACLVGETDDMSPQLEHLMQALGRDAPRVKRILELNPNHPLVEKLQAICARDRDDPLLGDYATLVHGQAVLAEGGQPPNPATFGRLVVELMVRNL